jgi:tetratricopeptide (TPR) repeat protein
LLLLERDGRLLVRLPDEQLADTAGQLCWDFTDEASVVVTFEQAKPTAAEWFDRAWTHEQEGRLEEAVRAYREALLAGGQDTQICINLGNALHALGQREAAIERYRQAIECDSKSAEAWNNLGNALAEMGRTVEAASAYELAIDAEPTYPDPHYALADLLSETGRRERAVRHWRRYLELESSGMWADYARKQVAASTR